MVNLGTDSVAQKGTRRVFNTFFMGDFCPRTNNMGIRYGEKLKNNCYNL